MNRVNFRNLFAVIPAFAVCAFLTSGNAAAAPLLESSETDDIAALKKRVDELDAKIQSTKESPSAFNPSMTVFANVLGCYTPKQDHDEHDHDHDGADDHDHDHAHAHPECANQIMLREIEFDFRAAIDPYASGVVILSVHQEDGAFDIDVEEAYAVLKPGFELKLGRFLSSFGNINRIHTHDLPWMTGPKSAANFLGDHGLGQDGASAQFLLPTPGDSNALTLSLETLFGDALPLGGESTTYPKFVGRLSWFFDLGKGHDLDVGGSTLIQPRDAIGPFQLYGADFNYRWRPYILGSKKSFLLGGELFVANNGLSYFDSLPIGGFVWTQLQFNQNAYLGFRYSYDQGATEDNQLNTAAGIFFTYYTTEFLRFRVGYERAANVASFSEGRDLFLAELNFIFGSHPTEPYWVNR